MLLREQADKIFSDGRPREAMECYKNSIESEEPGKIYSYINGAFAAWAALDHKQFVRLVRGAVSFRSEDIDYFNSRIELLIFRMLAFVDSKIANEICKEISLKRCCVNNDSKFFFILGFPRCGTSSISRALLKSGSFVRSLASEPLSEMFYFDDYNQAFTIWLDTLVRDEGCGGDFVLEKSTHHLLCEYCARYLLDRFPGQTFLVAIRDPIQRSFSAFSFARDFGLNLNLSEALETELRILNQYSVDDIFFNLSVFRRYLAELHEKNIKLPIIYPSLLMKYWDRFFSSELTFNYTFYDLSTQSLSGVILDPSIGVILSDLRFKVNESTIYDVQEEELDFLRAVIDGPKDFLSCW